MRVPLSSHPLIGYTLFGLLVLLCTIDWAFSAFNLYMGHMTEASWLLMEYSAMQQEHHDANAEFARFTAMKAGMTTGGSYILWRHRDNILTTIGLVTILGIYTHVASQLVFFTHRWYFGA